MQELRFVLIVVGALAIAALLFHGLWTSKKEGKTKFGDKPLGKLNAEKAEEESTPERGFAPEDDFEIVRKTRKTPSMQAQHDLDVDPLTDADPLIDNYDSEPLSEADESLTDDIPSFSAIDSEKEPETNKFSPSFETDVEPAPMVEESQPLQTENTVSTESATPVESAPEPEMEVIVLNVHCAGEVPFVGTKLFQSMEKNDLKYGEMDIFHYHVDSGSSSKVLFSVANMMQPGTLKHVDPAEFSTKGISFFMTLPCFGDAEQNFNLLLRTAQQIADDLGGNVLDDGRNLMTPDRLSAYRRQIQDFKTAMPA
ncbi:cell division protein ZipA [uncultured Vibrio sp.]|uniref:cell division protein ZipA n=1 Tax=uncultured Vibrio sp. TaxID=114054 RepID=UPI000918AD6F|nr:cell division protein ZipA [uncultured Vibrio sp.]OIQ25963.1 MAG: cell division protein ZipA [Vibrio sp. MedPE-SWchi]